MKSFNKTLLAVAVALASTQTFAAGFQLNSQSATGIGRAFAGDAVIADNAAVLSRNPAAMALFDDKAFSVGLTYADIDVSVKDVKPEGIPISYGNETNAADDKVIPNIYYIQPLNDQWAYGLAAFSNFGTGTDTSALANKTIMGTVPAPVDLLGNTEVVTMNFNASLSYRVNEHLSLGAGLDVIYGQGKLSREGNLPLGPNGAMVNANLVDIDADGVELGGIFGTTYEFNKDHRIGASYRLSPNKFSASGDINLASVPFDKIYIPLPDIFQVAGFHQLTDKFAVHYTAQLTKWGSFDKITVDNTELKEYAWDDSWLFSVGGTYTLNDKWTVRAGYMHDQGVVGELSSVSIPDSNRNWYTAGLSYKLTPHSTLDTGIAFVRGEDTTLREHSAIFDGINAQTPQFPTYINATTRSDAVYYSVQYSYQF